MKQILFAAALMAVLASCGSNEDPQKGGESPVGTKTTVGTESSRGSEKGIDVLSGLGFRPDLAYTVAYDIIDKNKEGVARHRVLLEILEGDFAQAKERVETSLAGSGYIKSKETGTDGRYDMIFVRKGSPTLVLRIQTPARGPALKNASAVGSIHLMWNRR